MEDWMNQTWWLYDLTVLAILVVCIWGGWRRGILRTVISLLGYGAAMCLSNVLAEPAAEMVYDRWLDSYCTEFLSDQLASYHLSETLQNTLEAYGVTLDQAQLQELAENADSATEQFCAAAGVSSDALDDGLLQDLNSSTFAAYTGLPTWMAQALLPTGSVYDNSDRLLETAAVLLADDTEASAQYLTENYIRSVVISFVKFIMFFIIFLLISVLLQVIIKWLSYVFRFDGMSLLNQILGAGLGGIEAVFFLLLMKTLTKWFVENGSDQLPFFQEAIIDQTVLFQLLYHLS